MICVYCSGTFTCETRPDRCPHCAVTFSITITDETTAKEFYAATSKNEHPIEFALAAGPADGDGD